MKNKPRIEISVENVEIENVKIEGKIVTLILSKPLKNPEITKSITTKSETYQAKQYDRPMLAKMLGVSTWTISTWVRSGILPRHDLHVGSSRFWYPETILPHVESILNFRKINKTGNTMLKYLSERSKCLRNKNTK